MAAMVHDEHDGIVRLVLAADGIPDGQLHGILRRAATQYGWSLDVGDEEALFERSDLIVATSIPTALVAPPENLLVPPLIVVVEDLSIARNDVWPTPPVAALLDRRDVERRLPAALHAVLAGLNVTAPLPGGEEHTAPPVLRSPNVTNAPLRTDLSPAESAVYETLHRGLSNREIAEELDISVNTVKFHLSSIFAKLGVHNRTQAVAVVARRRANERTQIDARTLSKFV